MLENRSSTNACCGSCRSRVSAWFIVVTLILVALAVGAIFGALLQKFILFNIVAIAVFAFILLLAAIFALVWRRCRCRFDD